MSRRLCTFPGCQRDYDSIGYCKAHAARMRRWGDPAGRNVMFGASLADRIQAGLPKERTFFDCWPWQKARQSAGYGVISRPDGSTGLAHRVIYEFLVGPVPKELDLDHLCRNKPCCNPAHLEPVTRGENNRRMWPFRRLAARSAA